MKKLLTLASLLIANLAIAGIVVHPVSISQKELAEKGIIVRKVRENGTMPVFRVDITVDLKKGEGSYKQTVLVVTDQPISSVGLTDSDISFETHAVRTGRSSDRKASFAVIGKESERSYIMIEVLVGFDQMAIFDRYLLPVVEIKEEKSEANQALEPTSTAVTPPAIAGDRASGTRGSS